MTENIQPSQETKEPQEQMVFTIPWAEKRQEFDHTMANEEMIAQAWDMHEDLIFFFLMWLGTY
jgi:hypothetical protein